jgi:hypothetical protein
MGADDDGNSVLSIIKTFHLVSNQGIMIRICYTN